MTKLSAFAAITTAAALVALQVVAISEFTADGSPYTRASGVAAILTLAILPCFIHVAWRHGSKAIAGSLFVAFIAFLAYSLPATIGRTGEVKASAAAGSADRDLLERDLKQTVTRAEWAKSDWANECRSGAGSACKGKAQTVQALDARVEKLRKELRSAPAGDLGSEALSWASMGYLTADAIRRGSTISFAVGLDFCVWALIWLATSLLSKPATVSATVSRASDLVLPADVTEKDLEELRKLLARVGRPLTNNELAGMLKISKGEASKRVSAAVSAAMCERRRIGREVAISYLH